MIEKVELKKFKRFSDATIELHPRTVTYIVGGNNSGKSSLLHALAIWEFCKTVLVFHKGEGAILMGYVGAGYGIAFSDFTPVNIPSFKYLWTNLIASGGYTLSIKCYWKDGQGADKHLGIQLSLVQERLFIKQGDSNLNRGDHVPRIAYLPTFAGISIKEQWYTYAIRQQLRGQGLAGAILRNEIIDLFQTNQNLRREKRGNAAKISKRDLKDIRNNDPYELLQQVVFDIFGGQLHPSHFDPAFHTHVNVEFTKGTMVKNRYTPHKGYNRRNIMVEGNGFLQWLSVYTFALSPNVDVLLLDEPDAHLHVSLQSELMSRLSIIAQKFHKQVLIATHAVDIIKKAPVERVLHIKTSMDIKYLKEEKGKTIVLSGIGNEYFPLLEKIQACRRILFVENESDAKFLQYMSRSFMAWPTNIVVWPNANHHKERAHVFDYLKREFNQDFKCISLGDKDNLDYARSTPQLKDTSYPDVIEGNKELRYRMWRRSEIENYLLHPAVIARVIVNKNGGDIAGVEQEVRDFLSDSQGIVINRDFMQSDKTDATKALFELAGKDIMLAICNKFGINKFDIAKEMNEDEVFDDIKTICNEIAEMCQ